MNPKKRCDWCEKDDLYRDYHDQEWGVPLHDDQKLFEMINLEGAQAGLSWYTILRKREGYYQAFDGWDAEKIVNYDASKLESLRENPGIVRNRLKIEGVQKNARAYLSIREKYESFDRYIWQFVEYKPIVNHWEKMGDVPARTPLSDKISKALKKEGFTFVGSTICYAFMQAVGMVDDHLVYCWKRTEPK